MEIPVRLNSDHWGFLTTTWTGEDNLLSDGQMLAGFLGSIALFGCLFLILRRRLRDRTKKVRIGWWSFIAVVSYLLSDVPFFLPALVRPLHNRSLWEFVMFARQEIFIPFYIACFLLAPASLLMAIYYVFRSPKTTRQKAQDQAAEIIRAAEEKAAAILRAAGKASIGTVPPTSAEGTVPTTQTVKPNQDELGPPPQTKHSKAGVVIVSCILMLIPTVTALSVIRKGAIMSELSDSSLPLVLALTAGVSLFWFGYRQLWVPRRGKNKGK